MNEIRIFENESFGNIRIAMTEKGEPLFCLADVCKAVGLSNPSSVKSRLDMEDVQLVDLHALKQTEGMITGNATANFITESGFYDVLLYSDAPQVKPFRKWITKDVLPSIRKTGGYSASKELDIKEKIEAIGAIRDVLNLNEASTLLLLKQVCDPLSLPLPNYVASKDNLLSAKELLKRNEVNLSSQAFNLAMIGKGFMEVKSRPASKGGTKNFKSLTKEGLEFGENQVSPNNPKETQPLYYVNKFESLLKLLGIWIMK